MGQLSVIDITSPGRLGVNTETSGADLPVEFGKVVNNWVITRDNRLSARKGFEEYAPDSPFTGTVKTLFETFNADGSSEIIWAVGDKVYQGYPTAVDISPTEDVPTDGNWQFQQLEDTLFATQAGELPLAWQREAGVWTPQTISRPVGIEPSQRPDACLSAFGRMWVAVGTTNKTTVWFSESLNALNFNSGGAGVLDINDVVLGGDYIVALGAFGNRLVVFCSHHVLIYTMDANAALVGLEDVIKGVGCGARDSVVNTGTELVWLAEQGVMSLGRLLQAGGQIPVGDISVNVHTAIQEELRDNAADRIKAIWWPNEQLLLYLFLNSKRIYCFNARRTGGSAPVVTTWDQVKTISCARVTKNRQLIFGGTDTFYRYANYGSQEDPYTVALYSGYLAFGNSSVLKFLKHLGYLVQSGANQAGACKWAFDYSEDHASQGFNTVGTGGDLAEFGQAEFGLGEFGAGVGVQRIGVHGSGSGQELQIGFESQMMGDPLELLRVTIKATSGKQV